MRLRLPQRDSGYRRRLPYGMTPETLGRGLAKLVAVVVAAAVGGLAIGTALAGLSGGSDSSTSGAGSSTKASRAATATSTTRRTSTSTTRTSTTPITTSTPSSGHKPAATARQKPAHDVRVRILSAVLHPGVSPSSKRRKRARLSVKVRVTNRGRRRAVASRPTLVAAGARVQTDPSQDTAATTLRPLASGKAETVTLEFETAGAVTQQVDKELRARLIVAGRNVTATVTRGGPVSGSSKSPS